MKPQLCFLSKKNTFLVTRRFIIELQSIVGLYKNFSTSLETFAQSNKGQGQNQGQIILHLINANYQIE